MFGISEGFISFYKRIPIFCLETGAAHDFPQDEKRLVIASTLVHLDEDVTIELSTHTSNVNLPMLFAVERWCRADDGIFRSPLFTGREPLLNDRKECLSPKWVVTNF